MEIKVEGSKLILTIDCSPEAQLQAPISRSGKTKLLASSRGFTSIGKLPGIGLSINVTCGISNEAG